MCFKRWREKKMKKEDFNVNYNTADVDYSYDTTGKTVSMEVKMQVIDRNSQYLPSAQFQKRHP